MSLIYLASPYSDPAPEVRRGRYLEACEFAATAARRGYCVISPIAHWHPVAELHALPTDALWWEKSNMQLLRHCAEVWVLCLPGWQNSVGVKHELAMAEKLHIPVSYVLPEEIQS